MATIQSAADSHAQPGLLESCKQYVNNWVQLLRTRMEIISTELEEEKERLTEIIVLGVASFVFISFGVLLLTGFIIVLLWEYKLAAFGGFTLLYLGLGVGAIMAARKKVKTKPKLFSVTLAELRKDQQHLSSNHDS